MAQSLALRAAVIVLLALVPARAEAQGTLADYQRATALRARYEPLAYGVTDQVRWVYDTHKVVYRKTVRGGTEFVLADADRRAQTAAFDHAKLAAGLSTALKRKVIPLDLPFNQFTYSKDLTSIDFQVIERNAARGGPVAGPPAPAVAVVRSRTTRVSRNRRTPGAGTWRTRWWWSGWSGPRRVRHQRRRIEAVSGRQA